MFCSACGTEVEEHARYCWKCGAPITQAPRRGKADAAQAGARKADGDDGSRAADSHGARAADGRGSASEAVKAAPDRTISHGGANITVGRDGTIHVENKAADAKGDVAREESAPSPVKAAPAPGADAGRDATPAEAAPEVAPASEPKREPPAPVGPTSGARPASVSVLELPTFTSTKTTGSLGGLPFKEYGRVVVYGLLAFVALVAVIAAVSSVFSSRNDGITSSIDDAAEEDAAQSQTTSSEAYTYPVVGSGVDDEVLEPAFYDGAFGEVLERLEDHGFELSQVTGDNEKPETATVFFHGYPDWGIETDGNSVTLVIETYAPDGYTPDEVTAIEDLSVIEGDAAILRVSIWFDGPIGMDVFQAGLGAWDLMDSDDVSLYVTAAQTSDEEMAEAIEGSLGFDREDIYISSYDYADLSLDGAGFEIQGEPWIWSIWATEYDSEDGSYPNVTIQFYPEDYYD